VTGAFLSGGITMPAAAFNLPQPTINLPRPPTLKVPSVRGTPIGKPNNWQWHQKVYEGSVSAARSSGAVTRAGTSVFKGGNSGAWVRRR
jgi:hypothetical protein